MMTILGFVLYGSTVLCRSGTDFARYPALQSGMAMLPRGLGSFLFMPVVGICWEDEPRKLLIFDCVSRATASSCSEDST
jgi:DHA2 family multidrug resistance protein